MHIGGEIFSMINTPKKYVTEIFFKVTDFIRTNGYKSFIFDLLILLLFNIIYWSNFLFAENSIAGFPYRQDGYEYMLNVDYILDMATDGVVPFGVVWFSLANCGFSKVILPFLNSLQLFFFILTHNVVFSYNVTMLFLYFLSSLTMYYLASVLKLCRFGRLTASIAYTFSQFLMFEMLLGHLSMVLALALIPLIVALVIKNSRNSSWITQTLLALLLSVLIIERSDFGYYTLVFLLIFVPIITKPPRLKNLLSLVLPLISAVLITFPFIELNFLSSTRELTEVWGNYNYVHYTPDLFQLITPVFANVEAYLGLSVVILSLIAGLTAFVFFMKKKKSMEENTQLFILFLLIAVLFLIIGLGNNTPLYELLYNYAPFFSAFRVPTRWLIITQLCFGLLAGKCVMIINEKISNFNIRKTRKKYVKGIFSVLIILVIFVDLSTFVSATVPEWSPTVETSSDYDIYFLPQMSRVPERSQAYDYISSDPGTYRIFVTPTVYSTSYWEYLHHLKETNVTLASGYALSPSLSEIQEKVESELNSGNITSELGEDLALLSVKYVIYDYSRNRWDDLIEKMKNVDDLEYLLDDGRYVLYLNRRFGDVSIQSNLLGDSGFELNSWTPWIKNNGTTETDSTTFLSGNSSVMCSLSGFDDLAGGIFYYYPNASDKEFKLSGWSKADNLTGEEILHAIRGTAVYEDGSESNSAFFNSGTHDWEYSSVTFTIDPTRQLKRLEISFSIRKGIGTVWFDDLYLSSNISTDSWKGFYSFKNDYPEVQTLFSERNLYDIPGSFWKINPMQLKFQANIEEPCSIVLSETFDDGWTIENENYGGKVQLTNYKGLLTLNVTEPCFLDLSLVFTTHNYSLTRIGTFSMVALILLLTPKLFLLVRKAIRSTNDNRDISNLG